jgi:hypothetical protein
MEKQEQTKKTCDHLEQVCERLCHMQKDFEILVGTEWTALDTVMSAIARGEKYKVSYPFLREGEVHRVWEHRICEVRFWLVAGEHQIVVHELSTYCQSPEPAIEEFGKWDDAYFVITGWTDAVWEDPLSKNVDLLEVNCGRAWRKLPVKDLAKEFDNIEDVVDDVVCRTLTACWKPAPDGATFIADCAAHFRWTEPAAVEEPVQTRLHS